MTLDRIRIQGARQNNLKNIDLEIPRDKLVVITGISGSGKSSLAFDTIYAEGQRRYVESLSAYARQFLGQMDKPDVDYIEGLSPAVSIDQKSTTRNPRSTVGTVTEIYDYLRLLFARIGQPHCPQCGEPITQQTVEQIVDSVMALPEGTRIQVLGPLVRGRKGEYRSALEEIRRLVGEENVESSLGFVGVQPSSYPVNLIFLWTSGPHEAVLRVAVKPQARLSTAALQEHLRERIPQIAPGTTVSFEAADLVSQVMSFGAPTPVEVAVAGPDLAANRSYAEQVKAELARLGELRDVQLGELLDYPTVDIRVDRERAAQLGVTVAEVGRALGPATWSSRFTTPVYWAEPKTGIAYQVQVEVPQARIASVDDLASIPVKNQGSATTLVRDVAEVSEGKMLGEYHRVNMQRMITVTANVAGTDLGSVAARISSALGKLPAPPRGVTVSVRGQVAPMQLMADNLRLGLALSGIAVFLLLAAYFQSIRVAFVVLLAIPSVLAGVAVALAATRTTLNIQSFMGAMMAVGISVANTILLCTFADQYRRRGAPAAKAAAEAARTRLRPVLMTSIVMIAGMLPLALGAPQTAPLGIAVIGGLAAATLTTLLAIPSVFAIVEGRAGTASPSLDPDDPAGARYDGAAPR